MHIITATWINQGTFWGLKRPNSNVEPSTRSRPTEILSSTLASSSEIGGGGNKVDSPAGYRLSAPWRNHLRKRIGDGG